MTAVQVQYCIDCPLVPADVSQDSRVSSALAICRDHQREPEVSVALLRPTHCCRRVARLHLVVGMACTCSWGTFLRVVLSSTSSFIKRPCDLGIQYRHDEGKRQRVVVYRRNVPAA